MKRAWAASCVRRASRGGKSAAQAFLYLGVWCGCCTPLRVRPSVFGSRRVRGTVLAPSVLGGRVWWSLHLWVILLGVSGGGAGAALAVSAWLPAGGTAAVTAVAAAVSGVFVDEARAALRAHRQQRQAAATRGRELAVRTQRLRDMLDPINLGVHPAALRRDTDRGAVRVPAFVERDRFDDVVRRIRQGGFVLIDGRQVPPGLRGHAGGCSRLCPAAGAAVGRSADVFVRCGRGPALCGVTNSISSCGREASRWRWSKRCWPVRNGRWCSGVDAQQGVRPIQRAAA